MDIHYKYMTPEIEDEAVRLRREFHSYPETAWTEYRSSSRIASILESYGYTVQLGKKIYSEKAQKSRMGLPSPALLEVSEKRALSEGVSAEHMSLMKGGFTGVIAILKGETSGKTSVFRFDIDGLPISDCSRASYASLHPGICHGCGHDGHIASGLALAAILSANRQKLAGEIRLIFQPAEEGCRGAEAIVQSGWLNHADAFYAGHIGLGCLRLGEIAACSHDFFATTKLNVSFCGTASHAAKAPEKGRNALLAAAVFTANVYSIPRHGQGNTMINVGKFISGSGRNIVADKAYLELETRGDSDETNEYMKTSVMRIGRAAADMYDVDVRFDTVGNAGTASSSPELKKSAAKTADSMGIGALYYDDASFGASEDAAAMMKYVQEHGGQAAYFKFGTPLTAEHHQGSFDFDEKVLSVMAEFFAREVLEP